MTVQAPTPLPLSCFPDSDGDAMPENASHRIQVSDLLYAVEHGLADRPRVHVGGNHFVYYNPYDPKDNVAPDVYVALDVERRHREAYLTFQEGGIFPAVVIEIISPSTKRVDLQVKPALYARLGALEYYLHDPFWRPSPRRRTPAFQAYWNRNGQAVPVMPSAAGGVLSAALGLEFRVVGHWLRVIDPRTGALVPVPEEDAAARHAAEAALAAAEQRATMAEQRATMAEQQARIAGQQATIANQQARQLQRDLETALAELARLRAAPPDEHI